MLSVLHGGFATAIVLYTAVMGLWALFGFITSGRVSPGYRGALVICEGLLILQGVVGGLLLLIHDQGATSVHILYGAFMLFVIPFTVSLVRSRSDRVALLAYSLALLLLFGTAIRASSIS